MPWLDFNDLRQHADAFNAAVLQTPDIDHFCSSTHWVLSAQAAFNPEATPFVAQHATSTVALMQIPVQGGSLAVPLEAGWGLAAPILGPDPEHGVALLAAMLEQSEDPPHGLYLSGIKQGGALYEALLARFHPHYRLGLGPVCGRALASLEGGVDGFLSRRSAKFRANLRRAWRKAQRAGYRFEVHHLGSDPQALFERIMAVEARSWKGLSHQGVNEGSPHEFYRLMTAPLAAAGALHAVICTHEGQDVGAVFGGVLAGVFRGLQVSFDQGHRAWSLGNLLQWRVVQHLCDLGVAVYDLGTAMPYKQRWAEYGFDTVTLSITPQLVPRP